MSGLPNGAYIPSGTTTVLGERGRPEWCDLGLGSTEKLLPTGEGERRFNRVRVLRSLGPSREVPNGEAVRWRKEGVGLVGERLRLCDGLRSSGERLNLPRRGERLRLGDP